MSLGMEIHVSPPLLKGRKARFPQFLDLNFDIKMANTAPLRLRKYIAWRLEQCFSTEFYNIIWLMNR
jgi:hypothetical protein